MTSYSDDPRNRYRQCSESGADLKEKQEKHEERKREKEEKERGGTGVLHFPRPPIC